MKIRSKLILSFVALIAVITILLGVVTTISASNMLREKAELDLSYKVIEGTKLVESEMHTQRLSLEVLAELDQMKAMGLEDQFNIIRRQISKLEIDDIAVIMLDSTLNYTSKEVVKLPTDDQVLKVFDREQVSYFGISPATGEAVLVYATPIFMNTRVVGGLLGRYKGETLSSLTNGIRYGKTGYAYIIDDEGTVIAHKDMDKVTSQVNPIKLLETDPGQKSAAELFERIPETKVGASEYEMAGEHYSAAYSPIE